MSSDVLTVATLHLEMSTNAVSLLQTSYCVQCMGLEYINWMQGRLIKIVQKKNHERCKVGT